MYILLTDFIVRKTTCNWALIVSYINNRLRIKTLKIYRCMLFAIWCQAWAIPIISIRWFSRSGCSANEYSRKSSLRVRRAMPNIWMIGLLAASQLLDPQFTWRCDRGTFEYKRASLPHDNELHQNVPIRCKFKRIPVFSRHSINTPHYLRRDWIHNVRLPNYQMICKRSQNRSWKRSFPTRRKCLLLLFNFVK